MIRSNWLKNAFPDKLTAGVFALIALVMFAFMMKKVRLETNTLSRFVSVECLVERGTFCVDSSVYKLPIDIIRIGDHMYSDKPPLYSLIMAGEAKILSILTGKTPSKNSIVFEKFLVLVNQVLPYLLMLILALLLMGKADFRPAERIFGLLAMSLGLLSYAYSIVLINHTPTAVLIFISFYLLADLLLRDKKPSTRFALLTGAVCALAISLEIYSVSFAFSWFMLFLLQPGWRSKIPGFVLGGLPVLSFAAFLNYRISGSIIPFYFNEAFFHYEGSYWNNPELFDALDEPWWKYLFNCILGHHGLLSISPLLVFGVLSVSTVKGPLTPLIRWAGVAITITIGLIVYFTNNYGGTSVGLRFFVFFMPVLMFMGLLWLHKHYSLPIRILGWILLALSSFTVLESMNTDPSAMRSTIDLFLFDF